MSEVLTPREKRAEAHRQRVVQLGGEAMTTEELVEAAEAVSKVAENVIKGDEKYLTKVRKELEADKTKQGS